MSKNKRKTKKQIDRAIAKLKKEALLENPSNADQIEAFLKSVEKSLNEYTQSLKEAIEDIYS